MTFTSTALNLKVLSQEAIESIHQASVQILSNTGVNVDSERVRALLADHGCRVDGDRVRISVELIEKIISQPMPKMVIHSRTGKYRSTRKGRGFMAQNMGSVSKILDLETGKLRLCTIEDLVKTTRLLDATGELDAVMPLIYPQEIGQEMAQIRMVDFALQNTEKPLIAPGVTGGIETRYILQMFAVVAGGAAELRARPLTVIPISPISPLTYSGDVCDAIWEAATAGAPMYALPCPNAGLTGPITMAGSLTQQNAEILGFTIISRLINPAAPVIYAARLMYANMKSGNTTMGIVNLGLAGACAVELAHFYGMESNVYGLGTSAIAADAACGYEKAVNGILPVLTDTDWLSGTSALLDGLTASYEQIVIDNEILKMLRYVSRELVVDSDTIAAEVIADIMNGQNFLGHPHTFNYIRSDEVYDYASGLGNSLGYDEWVTGGSKTTQDVARERVKEILASHEVKPLTDAQSKAIAEIVAEAEVKTKEWKRKKRGA